MYSVFYTRVDGIHWRISRGYNIGLRSKLSTGRLSVIIGVEQRNKETRFDARDRTAAKGMLWLWNREMLQMCV